MVVELYFVHRNEFRIGDNLPNIREVLAIGNETRVLKFDFTVLSKNLILI